VNGVEGIEVMTIHRHSINWLCSWRQSRRIAGLAGIASDRSVHVSP
jgi:hypothetical protein